LRDLWYKTKKKAKKYSKEIEFLGWKKVVVWKDFRPMYVLEAV
jgi:hypothetical protein